MNSLFCLFVSISFYFFFFFNDTATTEIYTLSLHDALPISLLPPSPCHIHLKVCGREAESDCDGRNGTSPSATRQPVASHREAERLAGLIPELTRIRLRCQ